MFHGADNDILWLQRDFHIYVVNLFDTAKVSICFSKERNVAFKGGKWEPCTSPMGKSGLFF